MYLLFLKSPVKFNTMQILKFADDYLRSVAVIECVLNDYSCIIYFFLKKIFFSTWLTF